MEEEQESELKKFHRKMATELFDATWSLLAKKERSTEENHDMLDMAHASRYHWGIVGTAKNRAVGEWLVSRVYFSLGRCEPSIFHATRCLHICQSNYLSSFNHAYAYEALARAHSLAQSSEQVPEYLNLAREESAKVENQDERKFIEKDLATIQPV